MVRRLPPTGPAPSEPSLNEPLLGGAVELVVERYPDGKVKVERQTIRDTDGNYVNHGTYTMLGPDGKILRMGEFRSGRQHGKWLHRFDHDDGHLFSQRDDHPFTGPFVSEANFDSGLLHGNWTVKTAAGENVIEWGYDHGDRHGKSTWWYANGRKRLEATYQKGILQGDVLEWSPDGTLAKRGTYVNGRHLAKTVEWYAPAQKHFEGSSLGAQIAVEPVVDWWTAAATLTPSVSAGGKAKHGLWTAWYPSGNKQTEGNYENDLPAGKFTWWYDNGQRQAEGTYRAGVKDATWTTWHANGAKESQTEYRQGVLTGKWMRWDAEGTLVEVRDFTGKRDSAAKTPKAGDAMSRRTTGDWHAR